MNGCCSCTLLIEKKNKRGWRRPSHAPRSLCGRGLAWRPGWRLRRA